MAGLDPAIHGNSTPRPGCVDARNRALQRALEHWQPHFLDWWKEMGPAAFAGADVYLRTATAVDEKGWASYGMVKMPEYRWGIFLADRVPDRRIGFGDAYGEPVWQQVPGEHRAALRRLIVTQGDTEPASVEQQRLLGYTCPSLYDLRNLFQVNVEEGRHLWAMVYLLHGYFGRDGREEAEELLARHSGDPDKPRILGTFNQPITDWLSFFMFTYFTDRDGRFQLKSLAESAFDPLSRTCRFMLTEEAFHMFVGASGITRVVKRTIEVIRSCRGAQRRGDRSLYLAALHQFLVQLVARSLRRRNLVQRRELFWVELPNGTGGVTAEDVPMRSAMNEVTRAAYIKDCGIGVERWNRLIGEAGFDFRLVLPSPRFRRSIGVWAGVATDPEGRLISDAERRLRKCDWLPSAEDRAFVTGLMQRVTEPGKVAGWIARPEIGINTSPLDYEYVRLN